MADGILDQPRLAPGTRAAKSLPFFERLPYDVRAIVYTYFEPGQPPPIAPGFQQTSSGFILSCRRAKEEIEEIPRMNVANLLREFKATFERNTSLTIHIPAISRSSTINQLRNVTVILPFTSLHFLRSSTCDYMWKREVLAGLHPLFALYFSKIRIHFSGPENQPACATLLDRGKVEVSMHSLLRDVTYMLERVNSKKTDRANAVVETIFKFDAKRRSEAYPSARVNAKQICLSWDLMEGEVQGKGDAVALNGKLHRNPEPGIHVNGGKAGAESFYHLRDRERMVGEMGIVSNSRWALADDPRLNSLLNGVETRWTYCSSGGLGEHLREGLDGVSETEFEEREQQVSRLIYT